MGIIIGLLVIGLIIFIHEFGHFIGCLLTKTRVKEFALGFGPKLLSFRVGYTYFSIRILPFGGFLKMEGEHPSEVKEIESWMYIGKPIWQRILIIFLGPFFNLISAFLLFFLAFKIGVWVPFSPAIVDTIEKNSIAYKIGLQEGDRIIKLQDQKIMYWMDIEEFFAKPKENFKVIIKRDGKTIKFFVKERVNSLKDFGIAHIIEPVVGRVIEGYPAYRAGLKEGDVIIKICGKSIRCWTELTEIIKKNPEKELIFTIKRGYAPPGLRGYAPSQLRGYAPPRQQKKVINLKIKPKKEIFFKEGKLIKIGLIGVEPKLERRKQKISTIEALKRAFDSTFITTPWLLGKVIQGIFEKKVGFEDISGPIHIIKITSQQAKQGIAYLLIFMAFISVQLFFLNLLPMPVLDGGNILLLLIEKIRKKPISKELQSIINIISISLLISLLIIVTMGDIFKIIK